jgi:hypothetical protein
MAQPNNRQNVAKVANNAQLKTTLDNYLQQGYVIHQITNLAPVSNELLIIYYNPDTAGDN